MSIYYTSRIQMIINQNFNKEKIQRRKAEMGRCHQLPLITLGTGYNLVDDVVKAFLGILAILASID